MAFGSVSKVNKRSADAKFATKRLNGEYLCLSRLKAGQHGPCITKGRQDENSGIKYTKEKHHEWRRAVTVCHLQPCIQNLS